MLLIPFAVAQSGRIVPAHEGAKGGEFRCPECSERVVWRKCDDVNRRSHFAHAAESACGEGVIHASAKRLVAQQIGDYIDGVGPRPLVVLVCELCQRGCEPRPFDGIGGSVATEPTLPSGLRPDVLTGSLAIEVLHTHKMSQEKIDQYARDNIAWLEISAEPVLADPSRWVVARASRGRRAICWACHRPHEAWAMEARVQESVAALAKREQSVEIRERDLESLENVRITLRADIDKLRTQKQALRAEVDPLDRERAKIAELKLLDIRKLEATYREIFDVTERARLRCLNYERRMNQ